MRDEQSRAGLVVLTVPVVLRRSGVAVEWGKPMGVGGGPLTWRPIVPHPERPATFAHDIALVTCANGHECVLSAKVHAVAPDGTVSPSDVCPAQGCGFHEFVRLDGWEQGL